MCTAPLSVKLLNRKSRPEKFNQVHFIVIIQDLYSSNRLCGALQYNGDSTVTTHFNTRELGGPCSWELAI